MRLRSVQRLLVMIVVMCTLSASLVLAPSSAASQNEVLINVLYDGTSSFDATDPLEPTGTAPEAHTPGSDGSANNLVVRIWDQFAVRVDWNINEEAATNVALTVVLPSYAEWNPDVTGMFSGCDPATSVFTDPQTLVCELGDQIEGSNGTIRAVGTMGETLDNTTFDVASTLTTDDDAAGVNDGLDQELTVSEVPYVDYVKASSVVSGEVFVDGEGGYVSLYPLTFQDYSQGAERQGIGPINDATPIQLWDHMWSLTPSARLAPGAETTNDTYPVVPITVTAWPVDV